MSDLGKTVVKKVGGREVVCRELTVSKVRMLLEQPAAPDLIGEVLFEDLRLIDLPIWTNLSGAEVDEMLPSQIAEVVSGCREANPHFFEMLARLNRPQAGQ